MHAYTGEVYTEEQLQQLAEDKRAEMVRIEGTPAQVAHISAAVKAAAKKARKQAKKSRKANRR